MFKVHVVWLIFYKFGLNILIWEFSPRLFILAAPFEFLHFKGQLIQGRILLYRFWKPSHTRFEKASQNINGKIIFFCFPFPIFAHHTSIFCPLFFSFLISSFPSFSPLFHPFSLFFFPSFLRFWKASQIVLKYGVVSTELYKSLS